jgi:uncharacterized protein YkwD
MVGMGSRCQGLAAVATTLVVAIGMVSAGDAPASTQPQKAPCNGVRLLAGPEIVIGLGPVILNLTVPLDSSVLCQVVDLPRLGGAAASPHCDNAQVPGDELRPKIAAEATLCLINKERTSRGLSALDPQKLLLQAAKKHTSRMLSAGCFAHECPGEPDLVARVTDAGYLPCSCSWSVGENLAWGERKYGSPAGIVDAWMASPPHREMILTGSMKDVDIGVRSGKPGAPNANAATYTADFGYKH